MYATKTIAKPTVRAERRTPIIENPTPLKEPELEVGKTYIFSRSKGRGVGSRVDRFEEGMRTGGRYNFGGAEMVYLGKTGAGYLFQSVANQWNKGCFSAIELLERQIKPKCA